jgi:hypothetical protein
MKQGMDFQEKLKASRSNYSPIYTEEWSQYTRLHYLSKNANALVF